MFTFFLQIEWKTFKFSHHHYLVLLKLVSLSVILFTSAINSLTAEADSYEESRTIISLQNRNTQQVRKEGAWCLTEMTMKLSLEWDGESFIAICSL